MAFCVFKETQLKQLFCVSFSRLDGLIVYLFAWLRPGLTESTILL